MLPASVSLRRAAFRAVRRFSLTTAQSNGAPLTRTIGAATSAAMAQRNGASPCMTIRQSQRFSTSIELEGSVVDDELPDVVLEPLGGFADQKPLSDFELSEQTVQNLLSVGITHLFPVQAQSFDVMMKGSDIVGRSKTGSGKTMAFALPIIERLQADTGKAKRDPRALILLPTRELAQQVADEIKRIAPQFRIVNVVGGVSYTVQENHLRRGADILVGTPGRIMDLVEKGSLSVADVRVSVLDEADMMLKFGFQEAVETILGWVPKEDRQCVMWSATFPKWVNAMAKKFTNDAVSIDLVGTSDNHVPATVSHKAIHAPIRSRAQVLENVLRHRALGGQTLIFTETKQEADEIANSLASMDAKALHGDLSQGMRTATMQGFRNGTIKTLVCTDIAARGLDIANVELVVQYRLPNDKESFVHRAGRTGRAGRSGTNIVFFDRNDIGDVRDFEKRFKFSFQHASTPHVEQVLDVAVSDISKKLVDVPTEATKVFDDAARRMLEEQGTGALSAALAMLCGFDKQHLSAFSMLTGRGKTQTVEIANAPNARVLHEWLGGFDDRTPRHDLHAVDDKFVLDIPQDAIDRLRAHLVAAGAADDVTVSPVYELSRVLTQGNQRSESRSFGGNRGGNDRRRNGGFGFSGRRNDNERGGSGSRDRDFDSSFSRGNRDRDRSPRRGSSSSSSFGRFSEGSSSRRPSTPRNKSGGFRESW